MNAHERDRIIWVDKGVGEPVFYENMTGYIEEILSLVWGTCATTQFWALAASMKLSVSFHLLDLGQSAVLLGRVISSSQGLC
jgi:hypothetical protein